jgi:predicted DNA-binding protein (MmcQ/YjbR family)
MADLLLLILIVICGFLIRTYWIWITREPKRPDNYLQKGIKDSYKAGVKS